MDVSFYPGTPLPQVYSQEVYSQQVYSQEVYSQQVYSQEVYSQQVYSQAPFDYEALLGESCWAPPTCDQASDPGYFSASGSSLSPTSSVDSFSFSPLHLSAAGPQPEPLDRFLSSLSWPTAAPAEPAPASACSARTQSGSCPAETTSSSTSSTTSSARRSWSRFPGRKRQTASEREKLRMRDLTKSLNHLRSFLPASVAPAGQTLTKIEMLRLTVRYIAHLSAQLGPAHQEGAPDHGHQEVQTGGSPQVAQQNHQAVPERPRVDHLQHGSHIAVRTVEPEPQNHNAPQNPLHHDYRCSVPQGSGWFCSPESDDGQYWTSGELQQQPSFSS